jgi:hypothetical protein
MPRRCTHFILRVSGLAISGSLSFAGSKMLTLSPAGGAYVANFTYKIGDPKARAPFAAVWKEDDVVVTGGDAPTTLITPLAPVTQRSSGSPSGGNELFTGGYHEIYRFFDSLLHDNVALDEQPIYRMRQ